MKIKYSPCKADRDTLISVKSSNAIEIDSVLYEFPTDQVEWPDIDDQTGSAILRAHRHDDGELNLVVLRKYTGSCREWDTGTYQEVAP